ncbi:LysR family transcriptional regulator [Rhodopseudomonas palustris]|uniref:LysR family transcriptional regulator n=1 Tax=Rhodopseudomonas palustris TaxID=1076 RepID=UPI002ACE66EA|nr:LysR family transcriptional regulator [Rhodopseudomonas palustris]WQG99813.1 LysR family transcriptional regulator [Rhodopseudomonas palustris]
MSRTNEYLDLNLLRVFLAIWDLRSLTAAGDRLGLTQPAISHALRRLRERFGDPLFVRVANRMLPTDAAVRLHGPLDQAFELLNRTLQSGVVFDPRVTERTFRVAMSDIAEVYILPRLISELSRISPFVRVHIVPLLPDSVVSSMRSGEIDLAIGAISAPEKDLISIDTFNDRYICLVRANHPIAKSKLTRANFSKLRFFFARTTSSVYQLAEQWLADEDARPRIAVRGHFTTAPEIVRHSDLVAIFPRLLALDLHRARDFRLLDLPFELPPIEVRVHSHSRFANDTGINWMCQTSAAILSREGGTGRVKADQR